MADASAAFAALSDAVLRIASQTEVEPVLRGLVDAARELVGARYAALGVPDGAGGFSRFLTAGMTPQQIAEIGPLPRTHGLLGAMLETRESYRTDDIRQDPRFEWWPKRHPEMRSFMGVPIVARDEVVGAFYLTDKQPSFTADDQHVIELFAAHAAVAIVNATLLERSRELSVVEERTRLARDLHDSVAQTLFSATLSAESAVQLASRDAEAAAGHMRTARELTSRALGELRSIVFELRPADLAADGLAATLGKHLDVVRRVTGQRIELRVQGEGRAAPEVELELFRIAQEAVSNALRHAGASLVEVSVEMREDAAVLRVRDDGRGFDPGAPGVRSRHLGLTSMEERARSVGARLTIDTAGGRGTTITVEARRA